jgi:4-carboxymuconolactone decarboxylase
MDNSAKTSKVLREYDNLANSMLQRGQHVSADDIDPVSRCRLPFAERDALDPDTQAIHDMLAGGNAETIRGLRGPGGINLHSPHYAKFARPVGRYLRYEAGFSGRVREVAILITARCCDSQFEWAAHESEALKQGVPTETIEAIRLGQSLEGLDPVDAIVIALGRETFLTRKVRSETYRQALQHFGTRELVDLAALMGNYAGTAAMLTIFDMQLDDGIEPPLPALGTASL